MNEFEKLVKELTKGILTERERAVVVGQYVRTIPTKRFSFKTRDVDKLSTAESLTTKEKAILLSKLLLYI